MHKRRPWLRGFGMMLLAVLLVATLIVGVVATTVGIQASHEQPEPPVALTTTIRARTLSDDVGGQLMAFPHATVSVPAEGTVTRTGIAVGVSLDEGSVVGVVNERPILLMQGAVPMWRTLAPGMHGEDVRQLQASLARLGYAIYDDSGSYGDSTALAMNQFLAALGYEAVNASNEPVKADDWKQTAVPKQQLVFAPATPVQAATTCGVAGQSVAGDLCILETMEREYAIAFSAADVPDAGALEGARLSIPISGETVHGTVGKPYDRPRQPGVKADDSAKSGQTEGAANSTGSEDNRIYLHVDNIDAAKLQAASAAIGAGNIRGTATRTQGATDAPTVESIALHTDGTKTWVLTNDGRHVDVETGLCVQGICEISGNSLADGTVVVLPAPGGGTEGKGTGDE